MTVAGLAERYARDLERAHIRRSPQELAWVSAAVAAAAWWVYMMAAHPPLPLGLVLLPLVAAAAFGVCALWIRRRIAVRLTAFNGQLETVMRLLASAIRAGLSMRQAFVLIAKEIDEPARSEFRQVVAQTDLGMPPNDALEALVARMPSDELGMLVRALNVSARTGGNLGKILDHLAGMIKERRRIKRKIKALAAEGTAGAWIIGILPIAVGGFIFGTQPHMRESMVSTPIGHVALLVFAILEAAGVFTIVRLVRIDV